MFYVQLKIDEKIKIKGESGVCEDFECISINIYRESGFNQMFDSSFVCDASARFYLLR